MDLILLDFSKAFDKVPHQRLLQKLSHIGIQGNTLDWIRSFLGNRTQSVVLNGHQSQVTSVTSGVPQGTVLGPLLFLVYINDLPDMIAPGTTARLFADDCALYRQINSNEDQIILQEDLNRLQEWERTWLMEFHPTKCQVIRITNRRKPFNSNYFIHNIQLSTCDSAKYLGLSIHFKLSWNNHIDSIAKKAENVRALINRNLTSCPPKVKAQCYKTLVRPILEYASVVWDPYTSDNCEKLERVQRRSARMVFNNWSTTASVTNMINQLEWETLKERRRVAKLVMMYRIINESIDLQIPNYIHCATTASRCNQNRFIIPYTRINAFKHSFFPSAVRMWNSLPQHHIDAPTVEGFKRAISTN